MAQEKKKAWHIVGKKWKKKHHEHITIEWYSTVQSHSSETSKWKGTRYWRQCFLPFNVHLETAPDATKCKSYFGHVIQVLSSVDATWIIWGHLRYFIFTSNDCHIWKGGRALWDVAYDWSTLVRKERQFCPWDGGVPHVIFWAIQTVMVAKDYLYHLRSCLARLVLNKGNGRLRERKKIFNLQVFLGFLHLSCPSMLWGAVTVV